MQKIIQAAFPSVDAAEYAASYLQQHIPHVAQVSRYPSKPEQHCHRQHSADVFFQSTRQLLFLPTISPVELNGS